MSFANGGASKIVASLLNMKDGNHGIYFMSDNLFVFNKLNGVVKWGSFDVSKMEGSHDERDLSDIINMTYDPYKNKDEVARQIQVLKAITLISSINTPALIEDTIFRVPYLASGCPGTADYNCYKMSKAVRLLWRIHSEQQFENKEEENAF